MGWIYVPLLGAFVGFLLGAIPLFRVYGRREYERGLRQWEHETVDVSVDCPCGAVLTISDATANGTEPLLVVWWESHGDHRITLDEYRARLAMLHRRPDLEYVEHRDPGMTVSRPGWATETEVMDRVDP